jgi:hypothetical protein
MELINRRDTFMTVLGKSCAGTAAVDQAAQQQQQQDAKQQQQQQQQQETRNVAL